MAFDCFRILFVIPTKKVDSPEIMSFAKRLARTLEEQGASVEVMMSVKCGNPIGFIRQGMRLRQMAKKTKPDVVVAQYGTFTGLLVALFAPRPIIITFRGSDLNPTPSESPIYVLIKHMASHVSSFFADGIVCVSREVAGRLLCSKPVEIVPSSTDTELFQPMDRYECRKMLGWEKELPTALFMAGNNPEKKRLDMAEQVSERLADTNSGVILQIIRNEVPLQVVPIYLNAADCLLYLSDFEGSPNLIREACACGTPIVTVPVGDVEEVLVDVHPSIIVGRDARQIASAVVEIAQLQVRSNGRHTALRYSNEITGQRILAFYRRVAHGQSNTKS